MSPKTYVAREMFKRGDRVKLTAAGLSQFRNFKRAKVGYTGELRGTVEGFGHGSDLVRVRRDGVKGVETYHASFWEVVVEGSAPEQETAR